MMSQNKKSLIKKNKKGFTLVEVILVMGLAAIMIIGIFTIYNKVSTNERVSRQVAVINYISNEIRTTYSSQNYYKGFSISTTNGSLTIKGLPIKTNELKSYYSLSVIPEAINGKENTGYLISLLGVSSEDCIKIIMSFNPSMFVSIAVNDDYIYKNMTNQKINNVAFNIEQLENSCKSSNSNTIYFDNK